MIGIRAMPGPHVAALTNADARAALEDFDHPRGDAHIDVCADQGVGEPNNETCARGRIRARRRFGSMIFADWRGNSELRRHV